MTMCFQGMPGSRGEGMTPAEEPELPNGQPVLQSSGDVLGSGDTGGTSQWVALNVLHGALWAPAPVQEICMKHFYCPVLTVLATMLSHR